MSFCYQDLVSHDSIRLIQILPGKPSEAITCRIFHEHLESNPTYEAMSYTWGPPEKANRIYVRPQGSSIPVTTNCFRFLKKLRDDQITPRAIWIDSICINQDNVAEKSHQVQLMGEIYRKATRVLVYPGIKYQDDGMITNQFVLQMLAPEYRVPPFFWGHLRDFLKQEWFSRSWVVQEIVLAREADVLLGEVTIPWNVLVSAVNEYSKSTRPKLRSSVVEPQPPIFALVESMKQRGSSLDLLQVLGMVVDLFATDPRDKIYAFIGLAESSRKGLPPLPPVQYDEPPEKIYEAFARAFIAESGTLDILSSSSELHRTGNWTTPRHPNVVVPSWVPNWRCREHLLYFRRKSTSIAFTGLFAANAGTAAFVQDHTAQVSNKLVVRGTIIGRVTEAHNLQSFEMMGENHSPGEVLSSDRCTALRMASECSKNSGESPEYVCFRSWNFHIPESEHLVGLSDQFWRELHGIPEVDLNFKSSQFLSNQFLGIIPNLVSRRMITTDTGFFGLGPWEPLGALVVCLAGGQVPYIIREVNGPQSEKGETEGNATLECVKDGCERQRYYKFLGEAYIYGLMQGEALRGKQVEDLETFILV